MGWLMIFAALIMGAVYLVGSDHELYYQQQTKAGILDYAGISDSDLHRLDVELSEFLFHPANADTLFFHEQTEVFGRLQRPFNEKELIHLADCRRLLAPTAKVLNYCILIGVLEEPQGDGDLPHYGYDDYPRIIRRRVWLFCSHARFWYGSGLSQCQQPVDHSR
jgi:hypothetical protein